MLRKLRAKCTGKNYYVEKNLTLSGIKYDIVDAEWKALPEYWILTVKRSK